jgi:prepilin-type N-terminal cleavage/methylation domain-containing protein
MRRGFTIVEVLVAAGLLAVLLALCAQLLSVTGHARRASERRAIALEEAANLIERVRTLPFAEVTPERLARIELAPEVREFLPDATAKLSIDKETDAVPAKRVRVEIQWRAAAGPEPPARLTFWVYPSPAGAAP